MPSQVVERPRRKRLREFFAEKDVEAAHPALLIRWNAGAEHPPRQRAQRVAVAADEPPPILLNRTRHHVHEHGLLRLPDAHQNVFRKESDTASWAYAGGDMREAFRGKRRGEFPHVPSSAPSVKHKHCGCQSIAGERCGRQPLGSHSTVLSI